MSSQLLILKPEFCPGIICHRGFSFPRPLPIPFSFGNICLYCSRTSGFEAPVCDSPANLTHVFYLKRRTLHLASSTTWLFLRQYSNFRAKIDNSLLKTPPSLPLEHPSSFRNRQSRLAHSTPPPSWAAGSSLHLLPLEPLITLQEVHVTSPSPLAGRDRGTRIPCLFSPASQLHVRWEWGCCFLPTSHYCTFLSNT